VNEYESVFGEDRPRRGEWQMLFNIIRDVYSFADPVYQQRVWVEAAGPEVDSYSESLCRLFDDSNVEDFADGSALEFGFTDEMLQRLRTFVKTLNDFDELRREREGARYALGGREPEIMAMPGWESVRQDAAAFLDSAIEWFEVHGNDTPEFEWSWCGKTFGQPAPDLR
jgi:hypothetical protein